MARRNATCPACKGPMKTASRVCERCRRRNLTCRACHAYDPGLVDSLCRECWLALERMTELQCGAARRPEGFQWPPGHLERLRERASRGEPLF